MGLFSKNTQLKITLISVITWVEGPTEKKFEKYHGGS